MVMKIVQTILQLCLGTWPMNGSEAGGDLALRKTFAFLI